MKYSEARPQIKSGDILAWSHRGWGSWRDFKIQMVRFFTQSEYSHVGMAWVVGERVFVIEAVIPCVRIFPLSKLGDFYWLPMNADWTPEVEEKALSYIGETYSQLHAMKAFFKELHSEDVSECAALVDNIATAYKQDLGRKQTPDSIVREAMKLGKVNIYVLNAECSAHLKGK